MWTHSYVSYTERMRGCACPSMGPKEESFHPYTCDVFRDVLTIFWIILLTKTVWGWISGDLHNPLMPSRSQDRLNGCLKDSQYPLAGRIE